MAARSQLHALTALPLGEIADPPSLTPIQIDLVAQWPPNLPGRFGYERNPLPPPGIEHIFLGCTARSLVTMPAKISRLLVFHGALHMLSSVHMQVSLLFLW